MDKLVRQIFILFLVLFSLGSQADNRYSAIYVFGDSLSDTGNMYSITGGAIPPSPYYYQGRFSNGPVWVEYLAEELEMTYDSSTNFAFGGARTGYDNAFNDPYMFPGLQHQIAMFKSVAQLNGVDKDALYILWAGANDILSGDPAVSIDNLKTAIDELYDLGVENLMVVNMPDLGLTPVAISTGNVDLLRWVSLMFNSGLGQLLASYNKPIIQVDMFKMLSNVVQNPGKYDLTNVVDSCLNTMCTSANQYLFWDHIHPTTRGHQIIAQYAKKSMLANNFCEDKAEYHGFRKQGYCN